MLNFKVYNGRQLQNFISMLNQFEQKGVTDIRFVREQIFNYINKEIVKKKISDIKEKKEVKNTLKKCPYCNKGVLEPLTIEGEHIVICRKCRYSEYVDNTKKVGEENVK